jgi:hypothetical protein
MVSSAWRAWPKQEKLEPRKNKCIENGIQKAFIHWLTMQYPHLKRVTFGIMNGGKRTPAQGKHLRELGMTAGIPDIFMSVPSQGYHGLYIEVKRPGGILSAVQQEAIRNLTNQGYKCIVPESVTEAIDAVKEYLEGNLHV